MRSAPRAAGPAGACGVRELAAVAAAFSFATLVLTYPQVRHMRDAVGSHYDALFSVWRLAWVAHALRTDPWHLFDANIFAPAAGTLAYSDAMLLPGVTATPFIWAGVNPVIVYNVLVLASFVACGTAMYLLVKRLTESASAAAFAGIVFTFAPFRIGHYPQLELLWSWPIPLAFWALHRLIDDGRVSSAVWLGLAVVAQVYSSIYAAVFLAIGLGLLLPLQLMRRGPQWRSRVGNLGVAGALCVALTWPYVQVYARASSIIGTRTPADIAAWSPTAHRFVETSPDNLLYGLPRGDGSLEMYLFPGLTAACVALAGVALGGRRDLRLRLGYAVLLAICLDLARGSHGFLYGTAFEYLWPLRGLRVPPRMYLVVTAALAVLGGLGLVRLLEAVGGASARRILLFGVTAAVVLEYVSVPLTLMPVPSPIPSVYTWLQRQPATTVIEWPVPDPAAIGATRDPLYMFYSTRHWQRLVNGYSGFVPASYIVLLEAMQSFPSPQALAALRASNVEFVVLHGELEPDRFAAALRRVVSLEGVEIVTGERTPAGEIAVVRIGRTGKVL